MLSLLISSTAVFMRSLMALILVLAAAAPAMAAQLKANDSALTVLNGATSTVTLRTSGAGAAVLTYEILSQGTKGTATLVTGRTGVASYAVKAGVNPVGSDKFTFRVTDKTGRVSNTATISITFTNSTIITWNQPTTIVYGTAIATPATATAGGVLVAGTFAYTPTLGTKPNVGTTRATAVFTPAAGGTAVTKTMNVKVTAVALIVSSSATKVYAAALPTLVPTYSGFVNGDSASTALTGAPKLTTTASATSVVGTYPITVARGTLRATNYTFTYQAGSLTITPAPATIALTGLASTYDGLGHGAVATTTPASLASSLTYDGSTLLPVDAGTYAVIATITAPNYAGTANASLVIAKATQTINFAPLSDAPVGAADQTLSATATSGLPVGFAVSGPGQIIAGMLHLTGTGSITVTATQTGDSNWLAAPAVAQSITALPAVGTGLLGSYFANETLSGTPVLTRTDSVVNFDWAGDSPAASIPADSFSVRWDGEIVPRFSEPYTLTFRTDDGVRVWLDGQLVVNYWNLRSAADSTYTFNATAGRHYPIRIEYYEHTGLAVAQVLWNSAREPAGQIPASQLFPVAPENNAPIGTGIGLTASYFPNETLAGLPALTRIDAGVNFDWAGGSPASAIPADSFSARWSGTIQPRYSEPYTLILRTDDGVRMWLDGQLVINDWLLRGATDSSYTFAAEAGRQYSIRIEYYEHQGSAVAQLNWYSASEFFGAVPAAQLYPLPTPVVDVIDVVQTVAENEPVTLNGTVTNIGSALMAYAWTQESGPGTATFAPANQTSTIARFPIAGSYVMKLWAFNGHVTVSDTTTVTVATSDVSTDLVAYYAFDETSGTLALDSSGHHHTGNVVGTTRTTGKSRGALRFNGTSYVWALNNEDLDAPIQSLTLATWLKPDTSLAQMAHPWPMPIYRAQYEDSSGYALMVTLSETDQFGLRLHHQAGFGQVIEANATAPLTPNAWVHAAGVYDGSTAKLYLNGVLVQNVSTGPITLRNAPNSPLVLGYGFEGVMDEVRIYHRALTRIDLYGLAQDGSDRRMPGVNAGVDQVVTLLAPTATFAGSATDDAASDATLVPTWKQIAGPAAATISNSHALTPQVTFTATGTYRFQLEVSDGVLIGRDDMRVEVTDGSVDLVSGLVLHYKADEGTGTLVADASGKAHDGTFLGNPQWSADGAILGALSLDGASVVTTPSAADLSMGQMTLSVWLHADRALVDMAHPFPFALYHADYENNRGFALMTVLSDTNTFGFRLHTGTGRREVTMDGIPSGTWVHVVATFDGQTMRLYRDGALLDVNTTGPIPLPALDAPLQVGEGFEGLMDDVRIYDRALSPTEVQSLHTLPPLAASG